MSKKFILLLFLVSVLLSCHRPGREDVLVFAFGSCNHQDEKQPMWDEIINQDPDVWIWLGDNIYGDSHDPKVLKDKYNRQKENKDYRKLMSRAQILATWDDHDYGINDGGRHFSSKEASQEAFLDFIEAPDDDPRRYRPGVYSSEIIKKGDLTVKIILLDARYFRDTTIRVDGKYVPNDTGDILGEAQWNWLSKELDQSTADIHLIGSGIQVLAKDHRYEKWANFPSARKRLIEMIATSGVNGTILLSGDRHLAEVSEVQVRDISYPLRDVTSSGLTHSYEEVGEEPNSLRVSPLISSKNFGLLRITKNNRDTEVILEIKGIDDQVFYTTDWMY